MDNIKQVILEIKSATTFVKDETDYIKIGIETLAEALSYNVKLLVEMSESHTNVTNEIKDRINTLEAQLASMNTNMDIKIDILVQSHDNTKLIQTGDINRLIRKDNNEGSSGRPRGDVIIKSPIKIIINESDVRTIKIKTNELEDDTPLTSKEEEYKQFTRIVYELKSTDLYYISHEIIFIQG